MEKKMLNVKLKYKMRNTIIRQRTRSSYRYSQLCNQSEIEMGWTHRPIKRH